MASKADEHIRATGVSETISSSRMWLSPEKYENRMSFSSNSQKSLPGRHRSDARRLGSQRTSSPAAMFTSSVIACSKRM
jgi:hypothetical protein